MFQDTPSTRDEERERESDLQLGSLFLPEWVIEIFYGGHWYPVKKGTYKETLSDQGTTVVYQDSFDESIVIITEPITGYKIEKPVLEEPKAQVIPINGKK